MKQIMKGKTTKGKYYVRPMDWAGEWDRNGNLNYGNVLFESENEVDCDIYMAASMEMEKIFDVNEIMECLTDNEQLKKMIAENPDLPIMYLCGEGCYNDDFGYTINQGSYEITEVTLVDDMICDDRDDLEDKIYCKLQAVYPYASKDVWNALTNAQLEKYVWKKVISVRLG